MPRSFLVKKVKLDDYPSNAIELENSYSRAAPDRVASLTSRLHSTGYISDYIRPSSVYEDGDTGLRLASPEPLYAAVPGRECCRPEQPEQPDSPQAGAGYINGDAAVSEGYSVAAFFITDGRSRRRRRGPTHRHACGECGKTYATSSNLSRHKQTHRSLDSKLARKCPTCGKVYVSMPAMAMHLLTHDLRHKCGACGKAFRLLLLLLLLSPQRLHRPRFHLSPPLPPSPSSSPSNCSSPSSSLPLSSSSSSTFKSYTEPGETRHRC
uniref:Scratch family zinc finger 1a n=1 Tax=Callorhinchus milii TaxID=7868 RepID=A0A4W3GPM0_CALMI